jgi:MYND finger
MSSEQQGVAGGGYIVRIHGLASAVGQKLNGHLGKVKSFSDYPNDGDTTSSSSGGVGTGTTEQEQQQRVPVWIDGHPEPMALQRKNIQPLFATERQYHTPFAFVDIGTGVGRSNILSDTFQAVTHVKPSPAILTKKVMTLPQDASPRFRGLLHVIARALKEYEKNATKPIVIQCTDLNLAQAINIEAAQANNKSTSSDGGGGGNAIISIHDSAIRKWGRDWVELKRQLNGKHVQKRIVMARYSPHRLEPPLFSKSTIDKTVGANRFRAVEHGAFHIYPCHHERYRDALEVRFGVPGKSWNESWLDYGDPETTQYVENVVFLHQADKRLQPKVLAQVDPQAFWSAIHHYTVMLSAIEKHLGVQHEILKQWMVLKPGISKARETIQKLEDIMEMKLLPDEGTGNWSSIITNEEQLDRVSLRNLHAAMIASCWHCLPGTVDYCPMYKDTRVAQDVAAMLRAFARGKENDEVQQEKRRFMNVLAFEELQLTEKANTNSLEICGHCGQANTGQLLLCARCECVAFCNERCQKKFFKSHKSLCKKISAAKLESSIGPRINFRRVGG